MQKLKTPHFNFEGQPIGCVIVHGAIPALWFDADDVCKVLRITDVWKAVSSLEQTRDYVDLMYVKGGPLYLTIAGILNISTSRRSAIATRFSRWVTDVVIPAHAAVGKPIDVQVKTKANTVKVKSSPNAKKGELSQSLTAIINTSPDDVTAALRLLAQFLAVALRDKSTLDMHA